MGDGDRLHIGYQLSMGYNLNKLHAIIQTGGWKIVIVILEIVNIRQYGMRGRLVKKNDVLIVEQKQEDFIILVVILRIVQYVMGKC